MRSTILMLVLAVSPLCHAQGNIPMSQELKHGYERMKKILTATAEEMPAADYSFKPTPDVRSFAQQLGHVVDAQYMFCTMAKGEKPDQSKHPSAEKLTTKAELVKALAAAFSYCDPVYAAIQDSTLTQPVDLFGDKHARFMLYSLNLQHDNEHYGMLVMYLRMKKLVPPTSQGKGM